MGISGLNDYNSFFANYRVPVIPSVSVEEVRRQDEQTMQATDLPAIGGLTVKEEPQAGLPRRDAALEDISLTFNKQDSFDYIGRDSDIESLDVRKAISDMQKDQVLQRYQYFVGGTSNVFSGEDGTVVAKFN